MTSLMAPLWNIVHERIVEMDNNSMQLLIYMFVVGDDLGDPPKDVTAHKTRAQPGPE